MNHDEQQDTNNEPPRRSGSRERVCIKRTESRDQQRSVMVDMKAGGDKEKQPKEKAATPEAKGADTVANAGGGGNARNDDSNRSAKRKRKKKTETTQSSATVTTEASKTNLALAKENKDKEPELKDAIEDALPVAVASPSGVSPLVEPPVRSPHAGTPKKKAATPKKDPPLLPPSHPFKLVNVTARLDDGCHELGLTLTYNMVVRRITKSSPVTNVILLGDQVLEVNDNVLTKHNEIDSIVERSRSDRVSLVVARAWNVKPSCELRLKQFRRSDKCYYPVVEYYRVDGYRIGMEMKYIENKGHTVLKKIYPHGSAAYAFLAGDRILDVDGIPVEGPDGMELIKDKLSASNKARKVNFLIERTVTLRTSPNPSCYAKKDRSVVPAAPASPPAPPKEPEMADDAIEIGCRESLRQPYLLDKYHLKSALSKQPKEGDDLMSAIGGNFDDGEGSFRLVRNKKRRRSIGSLLNIVPFVGTSKKLSFASKAETIRITTDVQDESKLSKANPKSGWIQFVRHQFPGMP